MQGLLLGGRYRLGESLGKGGMGQVWRADDEVLGRAVAVKELTAGRYAAEADRAVLLARTGTEARAAARINHPAVVTVHDVLEHDERPWIVMEFVDGPSLGDTLAKQERVGVERAAYIGLWVLRALRAAHNAGVLHRDVKPANVLLARDGRVLLTDFGIAQVEGDATLTRTGEIVGSVDYLAPERVRGTGPGPASDLFALGVMLYTAVEGLSPFRRGDPLATMQAVVGEEPEKPIHAGALAPVIQALLRKDPDRRPDSQEAERLLKDAAARARAVAETAQLRVTRRAAAAPPVSAAPRRSTDRPPAGSSPTGADASPSPSPMPPSASPASPTSPASPASSAPPAPPVSEATAGKGAAGTDAPEAGTADASTDAGAAADAGNSSEQPASAQNPAPARPASSVPLPDGRPGARGAARSLLASGDDPAPRPKEPRSSWGAVARPAPATGQFGPPARSPEASRPATTGMPPATRTFADGYGPGRVPEQRSPAAQGGAARGARPGRELLGQEGPEARVQGGGTQGAPYTEPYQEVPYAEPYGEPRRSSGRGPGGIRSVLAVLLAACLLGGVTAAGVLWYDGRASGRGSGAGAPSEGRESGAVPSDWERLNDVRGFSLALPPGWKRSTYGDQVDYSPDKGGRLLRIAIDEEPEFEHPYDHQVELESTLRNSLPDYERIEISPNSFQDHPACLWQFRWNATKEPAGPRRAIEQSYFAPDGTEYVIYMSAPTAEWDAVREQFDHVLSSWRVR